MKSTDRANAFRFIVAIGCVSLFADMTYEGARSVIGPFLNQLGATATEVGIIAGAGEMIAASLRLATGRLADRTRAYWLLTGSGYFLNLIAVPMLALAGNWQMAAVFIIAERTGKALRGPSVDVLLSESTQVVGHGWGFGLHAAMDQTGAVLGPILVTIAIAKQYSFSTAFLWLGVPAVCALLCLVIARVVRARQPAPPATVSQKKLPKVFWFYVAAAGLLALGFIDFPLMAYHFQKTSVTSAEAIPLLYAMAMGLGGLTALIFGRLFDRFGIVVMVFGIAVSLFALPFALLGGSVSAYIGVACWATGVGAQDALLRPGIAEVVSMNKRGSAFGALNGVYGVLWFAGSATMGALYDHSLIAVVIFGIAAQVIAGILFFGLRGRLRKAA